MGISLIAILIGIVGLIAVIYAALAKNVAAALAGVFALLVFIFTVTSGDQIVGAPDTYNAPFEQGAIPSPTPTPIPITPETISETNEIRHYLGSDISPSESTWWVEHPANGSFRMAGTTFHTGVTIENTTTAPASRRLDGTITGPLFGRATYDISGLGITRLTGTLGSVSNITGGSLTVTCADSGRFLGSGETAGGPNARTSIITIDIPSDVQRVTILLQTPRGWRGPGFGNAFFS